MLNAYILSFDEATVSRDSMISLIDSMDGVHNWLAFFPTSICVISKHSAHELSIALNMKRSGMRFLFTRVDPTNVDGQLPREVWDFINLQRERLGGLFGLGAGLLSQAEETA